MNVFFEDKHFLFRDQIPLSIYRNVDFSFRAHWHQAIELLYVESGMIEVAVNDHRRKLVAGDLALSVGGDIHHYETKDGHSQCIMLIFQPEHFGFEADWPCNQSLSSPFIVDDMISREWVSRIHELLLGILSETMEKEVYYELMVRSRITELCTILLRSVLKEEEGDRTKGYSSISLLREVLDYIEKHYTESITLKSLSEAFNVDQYNLSKSFNRLTGKHFKMYVNELRIQKAKALLLTTDLTCTDIAMTCGFESVRTFNRAYRRIHQTTPSSERNHGNLLK